jgi:hypothetical protein
MTGCPGLYTVPGDGPHGDGKQRDKTRQTTCTPSKTSVDEQRRDAWIPGNSTIRAQIEVCAIRSYQWLGMNCGSNYFSC